jgi:heterodisulfide reductase subunit A
MSKIPSEGKTASGSVLIVGGGIGGMQAALDMADSGFKVHMVQKDSSIGGTMAMLDKTFPTGDCAMCMLSPKLVEVGRHLNIDIHTLAEVFSVQGEPGNFTVGIRQYPRYVDPEKCTGCGLCEEKCPKKVVSEYEQGLGIRKAIYSLFPQAFPNTRLIDKENCIFFQKHKCRACEKLCPAGAIDFDQTQKDFELRVGAIILGPGLDRYNPVIRPELGFGRWPNVITSVQFERILSASGPYSGEVKRPGDEKHPNKVAWIQCVGSRDFNNANPWCSSVCCMYATKQAVIAREHDANIEPTIFFMEMRAFGKEFDRYVDKAKNEYNVRYKRAMISAVRDEVDTGNLILRYAEEDGTLVDETFDMVVLSVGLQPHKDAKEFASTFGIEPNEYGFADTSPFSPVDTSRSGIYVTGTYQGPKDIPETVTQGSAVAGKAMSLLADVRGTETVVRELPAEKDVAAETPKIGVFVCHCGINIAQTVDIPTVVEDVKDIPNVAHAEDLLYACSQDSQDKIKELVREKGLNRVVVASCTPRTHEPLFQETIREAGLNKYLFDLADIREQCAWCHMGEKERATEKAKKIIRMSIAKAARLEPLKSESVPVTHAALVIGGGVAGMTAALSLADQGFGVHLVEKEEELGGLAANVFRSIDNRDVRQFVKSRINEIHSHSGITVHNGVSVKATDGYVGNFKTVLTDGTEFEHGAVIVATGGEEYRPTEYLYSQHDRVLTQRELEGKLETESPRPEDIYVMIQCVGSREEPNNYCSRICCQDAIKNSIAIKEKTPTAQVFILYRDIRTYGLLEDYYKKARDLGVIFVRYDVERKPEVISRGERLEIKTFDPMLNRDVVIPADFVVLSTGIRPHPSTEEIAKIYKLTVNADGYLLEAHVKLRPVDFPSEGIFLCGLAHAPKNLEEGISQALAAAGRASVLLSKDALTVSGTVARHNRETCMSCLTCLRICQFGSPYIDEDGRISHNEITCMGCGICAGICPAKAFQVNNFKDDQIVAMIDAFTEPMAGGY